MSWKELGLSQQEYMAVQGTIELGKAVRQGLEAKSELTGEKQMTSRQKFVALRDYLSMKALEQALAPHVAAHQDMIETGDGPLSSIQLLMGNAGFSARDIHRMVSRSEAMAELLATPSGLAGGPWLPAMTATSGRNGAPGKDLVPRKRSIVTGAVSK